LLGSIEQPLTFTDGTAIHILKLYLITHHPTPDTDIGPQFSGNAIAILSQFQLAIAPGGGFARDFVARVDGDPPT